MARYENGWIKIHRRAVIEDIGDRIYALALWVMLIALANWKETKIIWEGKQRKLPPGSVVFGFREFAERWECSPNTVRKWAQYLHDTDRIVLEVCPRGCIATIRNWEKYQARGDDECSTYEQSVNTACTQAAHSVHLNEEGKKGRREELRDFDLAYAEYRKLPGVVKGSKAEARFKDQITNAELFACLITAIQNYQKFLSLKENSWRKPKTSFETFLGSKSSGFFWRDFITLESAGLQTQPAKQMGLNDLKAMTL